MAHSGTKLENYGYAFLNALRSDMILYGMIGVYTALAIVCFAAMNRLDDMPYWNYTRAYFIICLFVCPVVAVLVGITRIVHRLNNRRRLAFRYMFSPKNLSRFFGGLILLLALMVFLGTFTSIKMALPGEQGFIYDRFLADIDRMLHFGVDPWQYIHMLVGSSVLGMAEFNYGEVWLAIWIISICWFALSPAADKYRLRYFVCYIFTWVILGNVLAKIFISAGPVYYGLVTGDELRFAGQLAFFSENNNSVSSVFRFHAYLWDAYRTGNSGL
ncbi:MAG: hypothetical protein GY761_04150, partial [Hyphomicrobiales bacterium]|nr:hypothetical protein [Hyphomicrobiales bacterium]